MDLFCPDSACPNHHPSPFAHWFDYHGSYPSCGQMVQRYRCRSCGRTFSKRTLSIDYWTHGHIDYRQIMEFCALGLSLRGLSRRFHTSVKTIQNRIGRLARVIIPVLSVAQNTIDLDEDLVADGLENFCVSQDFPNNIHLLVGKNSQFTYGFNYALMRRKGTKTQKQKDRCERLYPRVDFTSHTIKKGFKELVMQMNRVSAGRENLALFTDERVQYRLALAENSDIAQRRKDGSFVHVTINSKEPRTVMNDLFSVNYMDREIRKDMPEYHRETMCFGRNVGNGLERLCVYLFHHNFIKRYRIGVAGEERTHAEVAGLTPERIERLIGEVTTERRFIRDGEVVDGGFLDHLWRRQIPTPLKEKPDYLQKFAVA